MILGAGLVPVAASFLNAPSAQAATARTPVSVTDMGAVGNGTTDDTAAVRAAVAAAVRDARPLLFPPGTYLVDAPILVKDAPNFVIEMQGRLKRKDSSSAASLLQFHHCDNLVATTLRTDGNATKNGKVQSDGVWYAVDEVKHDVRLDASTNVWIGLVDSVNPAADALYLAGGAGPNTDVKVEHLTARSDTGSGRSAVSVIAGTNLQFGSIRSTNVGTAKGFPMPGGFQVEPNAGDSVSNLVVDNIVVDTAGATGLGLYSPNGKTITNVQIGSVRLHKRAGVNPNSCDINLNGVTNVRIGSILHTSDPANTNQALSVDGCDNVELSVDIPRLGGRPVNLGYSRMVTNLTLRGRLQGSTSHLIQVFNLNDSLIDVRLRDAGASSMYLVKNTAGTSARVTFSGDWRKGTGALCVSGSGQLTEWLLQDVDMSGWPRDARVKGGAGNYLGNIRKSRVTNLTSSTTAPAWDHWARGDFVENLAPAELGAVGSKYVVTGWMATATGYHTAAGWVECRTPTGR
jgi:hypothetical protein